MYSSRMSTLTIDTHRIVEILTGRGFSEEQARGVLEVAREMNMNAIVTKEYLNTRLNQMNEHIDRRFEQVDARFAQVDSRFKQVDARFEQLELRLLVKLGAMIFGLGLFLSGLIIAVKFVG